jgi:hypothetical protein
VHDGLDIEATEALLLTASGDVLEIDEDTEVLFQNFS